MRDGTSKKIKNFYKKQYFLYSLSNIPKENGINNDSKRTTNNSLNIVKNRLEKKFK